MPSQTRIPQTGTGSMAWFPTCPNSGRLSRAAPGSLWSALSSAGCGSRRLSKTASSLHNLPLIESLVFDNQSIGREHHLVPSHVAIIDRLVRVGIVLVIGRVIVVCDNVHRGPFRYLDRGVVP